MQKESWVIIKPGYECLHTSGVRCTIVVDDQGSESLKTDVPSHILPDTKLGELIQQATTLLGG